jgi:lipopolysaccharide export system permease protein
LPRFDRYLLTQLLAVFGFFALVLVLVYWVNQAVGLFDQLIGDGQTALVFLEFSVLTLPNVISLVLPIAAFAAAVFVANRLTQDSEMVVMQATGFSSFRLARPVLIFGLIVAAGLLILTHVLVPASREALVLRYAEIRQNVTARFLTDGRFTHPAPGLTLYVRELAPSGELLDLFLTDARNPDRTTTYTAQKALFARTETGPKLLMINGLVQQIDAQKQRLSLTRFADFTYDLAGLIPQVTPTARNLVALSTAELLAADPADLAETGATRADFLYFGHNRFAQPFLAVGAALIGFAALLMGSFSRFGLWRQVGVAIVLLVMVQGVSTVATGMGLRSDKGWIWAYAAPIFGVALGGSMLWWSERPRRVRRAFA